MSSDSSLLDRSSDYYLEFPEIGEAESCVERGERGYMECAAHLPLRQRQSVPSRGVMDFQSVFHILLLKLELLTKQCKSLQHRIEQLEGAETSVVVPINTFAPRPFEAVKQILVAVEPVIDENGEPCEYIASFVDGAISATGDTLEEAVSLLKSRMVTQYNLLAKLPPGQLGKIPQRQLAVLRAVMRRIE